MKKMIWVSSVLCTLIIGVFIITLFLNPTEQKQQDKSGHPTNQEEVNREDEINEEGTSNEADSPSEPKEEVNTDQEKDTLSQELREAFTGVIESARDLFLREDLDIVALGDSLTQGVGDDTGNGGYVGILEETFKSNESSPPVDITNYGKRGNRTDQLLKRLESDEISYSLKEADLILLTIGANDVMKVIRSNFTNLNYQDFLAAQEGYEERLNQIIQQIRETNPDAPIYLVGLYNPFSSYFANIPELGQITRDWNRISKEVINDYENTTFIPIKDVFAGKEEELLWDEDHFHPNKQGYKMMAERVLEYIRPEIEQ